MRNLVISLTLGALSFGYLSCAAQRTNTSVFSVSDKQSGLESRIMTGNFIKMDTLLPGKTSFALNPGRVIRRSEADYFLLNLVSVGDQGLPQISVGDSLFLYLESSIVKLFAYDVRTEKQEISAFFEIQAYDLIDLGNARSIMLELYCGLHIFKATLSVDNIYNFRKYAAQYIIESDLPPRKPAVTIPDHWGFSSLGAGIGYEIWIGKYSDLIAPAIDRELSDFFALGFGLTNLSYYQYGLRQDWAPDPEHPGDSLLSVYYWIDQDVSKNYPSLGLMYGLSHANLIAGCSLEAGLAVQYHWLPTWQLPTDSVYIPEYDQSFARTKYNLTSGAIIDGFVWSFFLQIGGIWARIGTQHTWAAGIALPLPWW